MPQLGPLEIVVVAVIGLVVFGPDKLPEIARTVGRFMRQVRTMADDVKQEFSDSLDIGDEPEDEELAALAEDDDELATLDDDAGDDRRGGSPSDEESPDGGPSQPEDHPVAEVIKSQRDGEGRSGAT